MLKNSWFVVAASGDVSAAPRPVRMLGQDFVAFRDRSGAARLLSDTCVHRGGALSGGRIVDDSVECPYHGLRFGVDGRCVAIPAQPQLRIPAKARVDSYPIIERYGWIWAFLGDLPDAERPPIPKLPWVDDPSIRLVRGRFDWDVSWDRVMENGLDFAHAPFVHGTSFGDPDNPDIDAFDVKVDDWEGSARMVMHRPIRSWLSSKKGANRTAVVVRPSFHLSGPCTFLELEPRKGWRVFIASAHVPVDRNRTRTIWMMGRSFFRHWLFDRDSIKRNMRIFTEDHAVLTNVKPESVPDDWQDEVSVKSDALQIAFRKRLRMWEAVGNKIDESRLDREFRGRRATAIACPARRLTDFNWPIEEVPTLPFAARNDTVKL
ncbi:aromatic ring-hydroxylating dioxygenase subunit alpha [Novosphingobium sp. 9]|uniref:aromatic ring-hydroxylating dioxygenase subunit alpha n=1 Tax=Novosphingobium sp. 9 TaxID=2025349 RepID=UPI0028CB9844|nr:aromatic ring-hydroxylating dioxygenase subunit alpha [Novosphingobium sp. 9]